MTGRVDIPAPMRQRLRALAVVVSVVVLGLAPLFTKGSLAEVIRPDGKTITVAAGAGVLVRLDGQANAVFIADPEIADVQVKSPTLVFLNGLSPGETTLFAVDENDEILAAQPVVVRFDIDRLRRSVARTVGEDVQIRTVDDTLVIEGMVRDATTAEEVRRLVAPFAPEPERVINRLQVEGPMQVNLRVRVAEVSRTVIKELGINWDAAYQFTGGIIFGIATGNPVLGAASNVDFLGNNVLSRNAIEGVSTDSIWLKAAQGRTDLNVLIDALDQEGLVSILAEPNLTALSGETATFLAGGEFPILVPQDLDRVTIEYKEYGVQLEFTPTILGPERINMRVEPEVSELSSIGAVQIQDYVVPALRTRRAQTTIELTSGQSFAIAGLLQNTQDDVTRGVPGLADLPVLGALFRSESYQREETELVIIVTPYVVEPVPAGETLATPLDGYIPPNDGERILMGQTYSGEVTRESGATPSRLAGPAGFMLE